ncbi:MAG: DUF1549 and DUF1553 domain-containing protein, partial [Bdellovibrionales bacterium]
MRSFHFGFLIFLLACPWLYGQSPPPDFETQVIPVFTKAGCNSGACHGAAIGRGGFKLSLLGYDPEADYESIVREYEGRRVHLLHPEKSLLLRKPSLQLEHEGGLKLSRFKEGYALVRDWIKAGAPRTSRRKLVKLAVTPSVQVLNNTGDRFQLRVNAHFDDGKTEEVTAWTLFTPADESALKVSERGEVTALRRGRHQIMVRFLGEVSAVTVTVPLQENPARPFARHQKNFIDGYINKTLDQLHLPSSPPCTDETFVRRVYLDLIGTLPTSQEVKQFLADKREDRRTHLVSELLERPEYVDYWSYKWGDLLRIESKGLQKEGAKAYHQWIRQQVKKNTPLDQMAREMILSLGDGHANGPVNFHRVARKPGEEAEQVSRVFLGVRLQCANCHNHPLDRWTQDDYHGLAAIFADLQRGRQVTQKDHGDVIHPRTNKPALPRLPGEKFLAKREDGRLALAQWLLAPQNPYFARSAVNRIWRDLMGRGLVEAVDDHRASNPPTHPELLSALAKNLVENNFDVKQTIKLITSSAAYQRSSLSVGGNKEDDRYYSHFLVRPIPPVVLVDAVARVTGIQEKFGDDDAVSRAIALGDSRIPSPALDL